MSSLLQSFDPTALPAGQIQTNMGTNRGKILVANHSGVTLILTLPDGTKMRSWAQTARVFPIEFPAPFINWNQDTIIVAPVGSNHVDMELYGWDEEIEGNFPLSFATPPIQPVGDFNSSGLCVAPAAFTYVLIGTAQNVGNWPFVNNAVTAGLGVAGTIYIFTYGMTLTALPSHQDGTTVELITCLVRAAAYDSSATRVGFTGTLFNATITNRGGPDMNSAPLALTTPQESQIILSAGSGPPYSVQLEGTVSDNVGASILRFYCTALWSLTAITPPGLT